MSPATRAMQDDDTSNPATLSVLDGEALWKRKVGDAGKACADCHGDAEASMRGVRRAIRLSVPRRAGRSTSSSASISAAPRSRKQRRSRTRAADLLALTAYVGRQSRGMPIDVANDEKTKPFIESGRRIFSSREGQLNLSCQNCHDDNWGQKLAGVPLVQGHPTGYPVYRLEWQSLGSLQRRLRNCMIGMRAEPYRLRRGRVCRSRTVPDVARARHDGRDAGGAAVGLTHGRVRLPPHCPKISPEPLCPGQASCIAE